MATDVPVVVQWYSLVVQQSVWCWCPLSNVMTPISLNVDMVSRAQRRFQSFKQFFELANTVHTNVLHLVLVQFRSFQQISSQL